MPDDREQQFERALARLLRDASPGSGCPDAETLASYHERTLPPDEMERLREHIAGCMLCQEALALVAQSEDVPLEEWEAEEVPVGAYQEASLAALRAASPELSASRSAIPSPAVTPLATLRRFRPKWRWLAPIGVLAAAVIVWVGIRETHNERRNEALSLQTARNVPSEPALSAPPQLPLEQRGGPRAKALVPAPEAQSDLTLDQKQAPTAKPQSAAPNATASSDQLSAGVAGGVPGGAAGGVMGGVATRENSPAKSLSPSAHIPLLKDKNESPAPPPASRPDDAEKKRDANVRNGRLSGRVTDPSGAAVVGTNVRLFDPNGTLVAATSTDTGGNYSVSLPTGQYRLELQQSGFKTDVVDQLNVSPGENRLNGELQVGSAAETVEVTAATPSLDTTSATANTVTSSEISNLPTNGRQLLALAAIDHRYILAPGEKTAWRVGDAGKIEHSSDHGKSWKPQKSGISADLTAGSATSDKVCWLVGKSGTILLSTNGGKHWKQIATPIPGDLGGIHATDAHHASIWDVPNRATYETTDGGATWTLAAKR